MKISTIICFFCISQEYVKFNRNYPIFVYIYAVFYIFFQMISYTTLFHFIVKINLVCWLLQMLLTSIYKIKKLSLGAIELP